jgi:thermitase
MRGQAIPRRMGALPILCALAVLASLPAPSFAQSEERIIVKREPGLSAAERAELRADAGAQLEDVLRLPETEVVTVPAGNADSALAELNSDPDVVYAEPDRPRRLFAPPNDPLWPSLWGLSNSGQGPFFGTPGDDIHLLDAWSFSQGAGQTVAVVDSGIDLFHGDLAGQIAAGGRNFVQGADPNNLSDPLQHGTHVSGTIAARAGNAIGVVGVAPAAKVLPLRVFSNGGVALDSWIAQAFDYAGDLGVRVVNASLGGDGGGLTLTNALGEHPNTLYVTAAGNDGDNLGTRNVLPCEAPRANVLCVGATDYDDERAPFSNYGRTSVDLFAPGVDILSTWPGGTYNFEDGTSMAAPHVSGEAALLLAAVPSLATQDLKDLIVTTVDSRPGLSSTSLSGGRASAGGALRLLLATDADRDGVFLAFDACPTIAAPGGSGCPIVAPPVTDAASKDTSAAGRARDARVRVLKVKIRPKRCGRSRTCVRTVTIALSSDRPTRAKVTIRRRRCSQRRCRWVRVATRSVVIKRKNATVRVRSRRFVRGSYRVVVAPSSAPSIGARRPAPFKIR